LTKTYTYTVHPQVWVFARNIRMAAFENEGQIQLIVERIGCLDREVKYIQKYTGQPLFVCGRPANQL
jgi:hypothetical protein